MGINPNLPATMQALSDQERAFVLEFIKNGDGASSKRAAGYPETLQTSHILRRPSVAGAVRAELVRLIATEGASIGYGSLVRLARDTKAPAAAQVAAAKALLQGAGLLEGPAEGKESKPINEMDRDELRSFIDSKRQEIDKIERELADRAHDITPGSTTQALDPFE